MAEKPLKTLTDDELQALLDSSKALVATLCSIAHAHRGQGWGQIARQIANIAWNVEGEQHCREHDRGFQPKLL